MNYLQPPTWTQIKSECDVLDQMASQTVLKACDIGDMLRQIRATMEPEEFELHCNSYLSRKMDWANKTMLLSFRREAVMKALANGQANDSIRGAYQAVRSIEPPPSEKAERKTWPRKKAGRPKGSKDSEKVVASNPNTVTSDDIEPVEAKKVEQFGWKAYAKESGYLSKSAGGVQVRKAREVLESMLDVEVPKEAVPVTDDRVEKIKQAIDTLAAEKDIEKSRVEALKAKNELSKTAQQKLEIALRKSIAAIQADAQQKIKQEVERRLAERQAEFERREKALIEQQKKADAMVEKYRKLMSRQINGFQAKDAFRTLKQVAHPDRWEGNPKLAQNAMHVIKELESIFS